MKNYKSYILLSLIITFALWFNKVSDPLKTKNILGHRYPASIDSCADLLKSIISYDQRGIDNHLIAVKAVLKEHGVSDSIASNIKSFEEAINQGLLEIDKSSLSKLEKGEKFAQFGKALRNIYAISNLNPDEVKDLDFVLGRNVLRLEEFNASEFKQVEENAFALGKNTNLLNINYKQYKEYVDSFETNTPPYSILDKSGGTIITRTDIREIEAHNLFPVYIAHDMKHIQHGLYHERYMPMLFGAARSTNHKRYVMMAALAEGADTFQYTEERLICSYFRNVKQQTLEEGMMYLARATNQELDEIAATIGAKEIFDKTAKTFETWAPPISVKYPISGQTGVGFDQEIDDMFLEMKRLHNEPDVIERYKNRDSSIH